MSREEDCLFCRLQHEDEEVVLENSLFFVRKDNYPVTPGHCEIIPKKHIESFFDLPAYQVQMLYYLISAAKKMIEQEYTPDGYNIGINEGKSAGRTVHHLHVHLIPRYSGDVEDPIGGVRAVIPDKCNYRKHPELWD